jgi:hypothetical protein
MVTWQNTLNRDHPFEILEQERIPGQGGKGRCWIWRRNLDPEGLAVRTLKALLARKLRQIASRLEREALLLKFGSTSVERSAMVTSVSAWPSTRSVEKFDSTSSVLRSVE